jgi:hypothetical protein
MVSTKIMIHHGKIFEDHEDYKNYEDFECYEDY